MRSFIVVLCLFVLSACGSSSRESEKWAQPVDAIAATPVHVVTPQLFRCFEPSAVALKEMEKSLGIRSVISLRPRHAERDEISALNDMKLATYRIKMHAGYVDSVALKDVLTALRDAPKPIVIYSYEDALSVATAIAAFRIAQQGWSVAEALDELEHSDYGRSGPVTDGLKKWFLGGGVERINY